MDLFEGQLEHAPHVNALHDLQARCRCRLCSALRLRQVPVLQVHMIMSSSLREPSRPAITACQTHQNCMGRFPEPESVPQPRPTCPRIPVAGRQCVNFALALVQATLRRDTRRRCCGALDEAERLDVQLQLLRSLCL